MLEVTVIVWGIMQSVLKKKKKGCGGKDLQKKKVKSGTGIKERVGDEKLIIITNKCNCQAQAYDFVHTLEVRYTDCMQNRVRVLCHC